MLYTAKIGTYTMYETVDDGNMEEGTNAEPIVHTWKANKQYNIDVDSVSNTITVQSEAGTSKAMPVLGVDKELMERVFGINIQPMIDIALEQNRKSLKAEYEAAGDMTAVI